MVRQTTKVIVLEILGALSLLLMAAVAILAFLLASGPVEIGMFRDDVERAISNARDGREVNVERLTLQWSPQERRLFVVANNLSLMDALGREAGKIERADLTLDAGYLIQGKIDVLRARASDGWIEIRNIAPNQWTLAGDPLPEIQAGVLPQTPQEWLDRTNHIMGDLLHGLEVSQTLISVESLALDAVQLRILNTEGDAIGTIDRATGEIERSPTDLSLSLNGAGEGLGLPGGFGIALSTFENYTAIRGEVTIESLPFAELTSRFGIDVFDGNALDVDATFVAGATKSDGLERIGLVLGHKDGALAIPGTGDILRDFALDLSYSPALDTVEIATLALKSDRLVGTFAGELQNILAENTLRRLVLNAEGVEVDFTPALPDVLALKDLQFSADLSDDFTILAIDRVSAGLGAAVFQASGELNLAPERRPSDLPISLDLTAEVVGELSKNEVLSFWPVKLGAGARRFVVDRIPAIAVTEASASLSLRPDSLEGGFLRDEDLGVSFGFKEGSVKFLSDVPAVENAVGSGRLSGNSFGVSVLSATYDDWTINRGTVDFPAFNPRGEKFVVVAEGSGPAVSILRQLSQSRLKLEERTGFDPDRVSGDAAGIFILRRPALSNVPFEEVEIEATGKISDAGLKTAVLGVDMTGGNVDVVLEDNTLVLKGFGDLGPAPIQFTWRDKFGEGTGPADLSASALVTPDVLNQFGLLGRAYLSGEIPVEMQGKVGAGGLGEADFGFDLREARINVEEIGWVKPAGQAARATLSYKGDGLEQASALRLQSDSAILDGDLLMGADQRLESLTLRRLWVDGQADVAGAIRRKGDGLAEINLTGPFLDISTLLGDLTSIGDAGGGEAVPALQFSAAVDRLRLRRGLDLNQARLSLDSADGYLRFVDAAGKITGGGDLNATFESDGPASAPRISLISTDAGFIAEAFLGLDFILGGRLDLSGTLPNGNTPARLQAKVRDARLTNAPFVTQILSLASLRGLADTLSGDGVLFSDIDVPIQIGGGRYVVDGGRASGPALGLTVNGWIGTDGEGINLDGVLVPSFGVNSMLGGVPVIGDLFVGREGEGIFSITYSVRGTLEKAQVAVNPLSAVTPGILRRIFENPSDTSIPDALPVDPNLRPPQPKLPELPEDEVLGETPG